MVNWESVLNVGGDSVVSFALGEASGRDLERQVRFTSAAGEVRQLLRKHGVQEARRVAKKACKRRNLI